MRLALVCLLALGTAASVQAGDPCDDYLQLLKAQVKAQNDLKNTAATATLKEQQLKAWNAVQAQYNVVYYDGKGARRSVDNHENFHKHGDDESLGFPEFLQNNYDSDDWGDKDKKGTDWKASGRKLWALTFGEDGNLKNPKEGSLAWYNQQLKQKGDGGKSAIDAREQAQKDANNADQKVQDFFKDHKDFQREKCDKTWPEAQKLLGQLPASKNTGTFDPKANDIPQAQPFQPLPNPDAPKDNGKSGDGGKTPDPKVDGGTKGGSTASGVPADLKARLISIYRFDEGDTDAFAGVNEIYGSEQGTPGTRCGNAVVKYTMKQFKAQGKIPGDAVPDRMASLTGSTATVATITGVAIYTASGKTVAAPNGATVELLEKPNPDTSWVKVRWNGNEGTASALWLAP